MNCSTRLNSDLIEQMSDLLAEQVRQVIAGHPEYDSGDIEGEMRQLMQLVGAKAMGKSLTAQDERYPTTAPCSCGHEARYVMRRPAASRLAKELLLLEVSDNTIRKVTQAIGERQALREKIWCQQSQELDYLRQPERTQAESKRLYGSIDGVLAPLEDEWREL